MFIAVELRSCVARIFVHCVHDETISQSFFAISASIASKAPASRPLEEGSIDHKGKGEVQVSIHKLIILGDFSFMQLPYDRL